MFGRKDRELLGDIVERLRGLGHDAELMRTVLIVKEPNSVAAAESYDGLRKQIVAGAAERRSHLNQLVSMDVAVNRATSLDDMRVMVADWMRQAGVVALYDVPNGARVEDLYEDLDHAGFAQAQAIEVVEPAYVDAHTGALMRMGRARAGAQQTTRAVEPPKDVRAEENPPPVVESAADPEQAEVSTQPDRRLES